MANTNRHKRVRSYSDDELMRRIGRMKREGHPPTMLHLQHLEAEARRRRLID